MAGWVQSPEAGQTSSALLPQKPGYEGARLPQAVGILRDQPDSLPTLQSVKVATSLVDQVPSH